MKSVDDKPTIPELLAPAGDMTSLQAALDAGADAVYLGLDRLNMRNMPARNFTPDTLPEASRRCRARNVRLYLTLNTIIYENELPVVAELLPVAKPHIDAVILSDLAVAEVCRRHQIPFHISTQFSCSNSASASLLKSLGASRIVLARECTLDEIRQISQRSGVETEVFIHGAQCVALSGRCFLSHEAYGLSASRGQCLQPCRREYDIREIRDGENSDAEFTIGSGYVLSARDLCSLPFLDQIVATGAASLKIEGRARNADYVHATTSAYRAALDAIASNTFTPQLIESLLDRCRNAYHRPWHTGLFHGRPGGSDQFADTDENQALRKKLHVGVILNYYPKAQAAQVLVHAPEGLHAGAELCIQGPTTGIVELTAAELRHEDARPDFVPHGQWATFRCDQRVRQGDKVFRWQNTGADSPGLP